MILQLFYTPSYYSRVHADASLAFCFSLTVRLDDFCSSSFSATFFSLGSIVSGFIAEVFASAGLALALTFRTTGMKPVSSSYASGFTLIDNWRSRPVSHGSWEGTYNWQRRKSNKLHNQSSNAKTHAPERSSRGTNP